MHMYINSHFFSSHLFIYLLLSVCMMCLKKVCVHAADYVWKAEDNFVGLVLLSPCGFQGLNLGHQLAWQAPLSVEQSHWPYSVLLESEHFPRIGTILKTIILCYFYRTWGSQLMHPARSGHLSSINQLKAKLKVGNRKRRFIYCGHVVEK